MWRITNWNTRSQRYDFTDAGLSWVDVTLIESDGEELCNGIELCEWESDDDRMQLIVCRTCGIQGCEPKGWMTFRRAGGHVFWIPLFAELLDDDDWAVDNYSPPNYYRTHGVPYFTEDDYSRFQSRFSRFPALKMIPPLKVSEAIRCIQHDAPGRLLGDIYHGRDALPQLSNVLAATEGELEKWISILRSSFEIDSKDSSLAKVEQPAAGDRLLTIFPDIKDFPEWHVFWLGEQFGYYLAPNLKLVNNKLTMRSTQI